MISCTRVVQRAELLDFSQAASKDVAIGRLIDAGKQQAQLRRVPGQAEAVDHAQMAAVFLAILRRGIPLEQKLSRAVGYPYSAPWLAAKYGGQIPITADWREAV